MFISGAIQETQSMIDLFWVGHLGSHAIAAVSMSMVVLFLLSPVAIGLMVGSMAIVSRRVGAMQWNEAGEAAAQSLVLSGVLGGLLSVLGWFLAPHVFPLFGMHATDMPQNGVDPSLVVHEGIAFLRIILACQWIFFLMLASFASLQASGDARTPMICSLTASIANIILDPFLIYGIGPVFVRCGISPHWIEGCAARFGFSSASLHGLGVSGAAIATVVSEVLALAVGLAAMRQPSHHLPLRRHAFRPNLGLCWRILRIGLPGSGQMFVRSSMSAALMRIVATCGPSVVAGYGVGLRWHMFILMPAFALGNATATLVGQNLGAKQPMRARHTAWLASWIDASIMIVFAILALIAAPNMMRLFTQDPEVVRVGAEYLRIVSPFYPAVAFGIILGRALNGAGDSMAPMIITGISLWMLQLPAAFLLSHKLHHAALGIWVAIALGNVIHAVLITGRFRSGVWMRQEV